MPANRKLFVNIAVADLGRAVDFFTALGFEFDPRFTDESATCMLIGEDAYAMLLVRDRFQDFTKKEVADPTAQTEAILALSAESREDVDALADKALATGGSPADESDGARLHVQPQLPGPRRPPVGGLLDGPGRRRAGLGRRRSVLVEREDASRRPRPGPDPGRGLSGGHAWERIAFACTVGRASTGGCSGRSRCLAPGRVRSRRGRWARTAGGGAGPGRACGAAGPSLARRCR